MNHYISIVEIPVSDFSRAKTFYQSLLTISIEEVDMNSILMGVFPGDGDTVSVALVKGDGYKPSGDGAVLYLNGGTDLQPILSTVEQYGGEVIVPKTAISPGMGYFAQFQDTEGNRLGLYSGQ